MKELKMHGIEKGEGLRSKPAIVGIRIKASLRKKGFGVCVRVVHACARVCVVTIRTRSYIFVQR